MCYNLIFIFHTFSNFAVENEMYFEENSNLEIITDFELASINAINEVFNFATHSACFFHSTQSINRKIQFVGLSNKYLNNDYFNVLAHQIPVNMVRDGWNNLKMQFSNDENEQQFVSYFDENYISCKIRMRYLNNRTPKRYEPIFPPEMWSVSSRTLTGTPRTSNSAEGNRIIMFTDFLHLTRVYTNLSVEYRKKQVSVERLITNSTSISTKINDHNIRLQNICTRLEQNPG